MLCATRSCWATTRRNATESINLQLRADRRSAGDMIGGAIRRELMRVPEQLLLVRQPLFGFRGNNRDGRVGQFGRNGDKERTALSASSRIPPLSRSAESGSAAPRKASISTLSSMAVSESSPRFSRGRSRSTLSGAKSRTAATRSRKYSISRSRCASPARSECRRGCTSSEVAGIVGYRYIELLHKRLDAHSPGKPPCRSAARRDSRLTLHLDEPTRVTNRASQSTFGVAPFWCGSRLSSIQNRSRCQG